MDQNHPIPQEISSYQFRLVGDMTLKQFIQLAGGLLLALLLYATGLHPLIKWPLVLISGLGGAALAFLPFEERPLSLWVLSFFHSIYSPTEYYWDKPGKDYVFFQTEPVAGQQATATQGQAAQPIVPEGKSPPEEQTDESKPANFTSRLDTAEKGIIERINSLVAGIGIHKSAPAPVAPPPTLDTKATNPQQSKEELRVVPQVPVQIASKGFRPQVVVEETMSKVPVEEKTVYQTTQVDTPQTTVQPTQAQAPAQFSLDAAPPSPPIAPNTITGQVLDVNGKIVEGAILEVKDVAGRPVRALKSNKLGHFMIVTSLPNGSYQLSTEKDGLVFDDISFQATGENIPAIAIRAKNEITN